MPRKNTLYAAILLTLTAVKLDAFEVDIGYKDALEKLGIYTINDLAAGQRGLLDNFPLCQEGGRLLVYDYPLDPDPWQEHWEVMRMPSGEFSVNFMPGKNSAGNELTSFSWLYFTIGPCSPVVRSDKLPVSTLNGYEKYSDWLEYIKSKFTTQQ
jgi:hypothetical protein